MFRQAQASSNRAMSFGKARRVYEQSKKTTFEDVAGCTEAKQNSWIVDFLKSTKYERMVPIFRRRLAVGAPGTGKTIPHAR